MNSLRLAVCGALLLPAGAEQAARAPMRDAVTHDQIVAAARAAKKDTPPPVFTPSEGEDPSVANRPRDILSRSEIFCYLGNATIVPKRALLHLPTELTGRTGMKEGAKFIAWSEFLSANRAWIRTVEVSRAQAEGRAPLDEDVVKSFAKERRVVISTYQEGPISVTPLRTPPPEAAVPGGANSKPSPTVAKP